MTKFIWKPLDEHKLYIVPILDGVQLNYTVSKAIVDKTTVYGAWFRTTPATLLGMSFDYNEAIKIAEDHYGKNAEKQGKTRPDRGSKSS